MRSLLQIASILLVLLSAAAATNLPPSALRSVTISAVGAFASNNITLILTVPNRLIPSSAANRSAAALWLYSHPRTHISLISAGSDVITTTSDATTFTFTDITTTSFPPSAAKLFQFLHATNSSLLITPYPYNISRINYSEIPAGSVFFQEHPFNLRDDDVITGERRRNFFLDVMFAAMVAAIADMIFD